MLVVQRVWGRIEMSYEVGVQRIEQIDIGISPWYIMGGNAPSSG
jgi:hypothetical protein